MWIKRFRDFEQKGWLKNKVLCGSIRQELWIVIWHISYFFTFLVLLSGTSTNRVPLVVIMELSRRTSWYLDRGYLSSQGLFLRLQCKPESRTSSLNDTPRVTNLNLAVMKSAEKSFKELSNFFKIWLRVWKTNG